MTNIQEKCNWTNLIIHLYSSYSRRLQQPSCPVRWRRDASSLPTSFTPSSLRAGWVVAGCRSVTLIQIGLPACLPLGLGQCRLAGPDWILHGLRWVRRGAPAGGLLLPGGLLPPGPQAAQVGRGLTEIDITSLHVTCSDFLMTAPSATCPDTRCLSRVLAASSSSSASSPSTVAARLVPQKVASELHPKVRNHGEGPY